MTPEERERARAPSVGAVSVSLPNPSLSQSSLLAGMPLLYHQSSLSTLLLATSARDSALSEGFSLSVPTQLVLPSGGIALGLPPSPLVPSTRQSASGSGSGDAAVSEDERVSRLRQGPVAVFASESPGAFGVGCAWQETQISSSVLQSSQARRSTDLVGKASSSLSASVVPS